MTTTDQIVEELKLRFSESAFCDWWVTHNGFGDAERTWFAKVRVRSDWAPNVALIACGVGLDELLTAVRALPLPQPSTVEGRQTRHLEILRAEVDRYMPCPDCRDKVKSGDCFRCRWQASESKLATLTAERDRLLAHVHELVDDCIYVRVNQIHEEMSQPGMTDYRMAECYLDAADSAKEYIAALTPPEPAKG